jgi:hypothetical protein
MLQTKANQIKLPEAQGFNELVLLLPEQQHKQRHQSQEEAPLMMRHQSHCRARVAGS